MTFCILFSAVEWGLMGEVRIRKAAVEDAVGLAQLKHFVEDPIYRSYGTNVEHDEDMRIYTDPSYIRAKLAEDRTEMYLAENGTGLVGMLGLACTDDGGFIFSLAARSGGHGIGSSLVSTAIEKLRSNGSDRVWCEVFEQNENAVRFFTKLGFRQFSQRPSEAYSGQILLQLESSPAEVRRRLSERIAG
jgi:ribosomal protein S18 acetylase RimI-like enzyme